MPDALVSYSRKDRGFAEKLERALEDFNPPYARIWEYSSGKVKLMLKGHTEVVNDIAFSPDGALVATASTDGTTRIWSASDGKELLRISSDTPEFTAVSFSPDGRRLATANRDKVAEVWEIPTGRKLFTVAGHTGGVWGVCFSPDGKRLATASYDKTARVWDSSPFDEGLLVLSGHRRLDIFYSQANRESSQFHTFKHGQMSPH